MARPDFVTQAAAEDGFIRELRARFAWHGITSATDIAGKIGVPKTTWCRKMREPDSMFARDIRKVVKTVKPDPSVVLEFLGYSRQDIKKWRDGL